MEKNKVQILMIPGYGNSGPKHWQTLWENENSNFSRVNQSSWDKPNKTEWVNSLQQVILSLHSPIILVGHSLGCLTIVYWASIFQNKNVMAALLVAPADAEKEGFLDGVEGFAPIPLIKLPFESILVASTSDDYLEIERAKEFADNWGSEFVNIGDCGHINTDSGHGEWNFGKDLLKKLIDKA